MRRTALVCTSLILALPILAPSASAASARNVVTTAAAKATQPMPVCAEPRCISYRSHCSRRCCFDACNASKVVLQVPDHCCCCLVEVPVCVPACCEGAPTVCSHCGIFGRQVVEYSWCCGYHVKVIFDRCGNVVVHTYGL
jgi:hypothetical protein